MVKVCIYAGSNLHVAVTMVWNCHGYSLGLSIPWSDVNVSRLLSLLSIGKEMVTHLAAHSISPRQSVSLVVSHCDLVLVAREDDPRSGMAEECQNQTCYSTSRRSSRPTPTPSNKLSACLPLILLVPFQIQAVLGGGSCMEEANHTVLPLFYKFYWFLSGHHFNAFYFVKFQHCCSTSNKS